MDEKEKANNNSEDIEEILRILEEYGSEVVKEEKTSAPEAIDTSNTDSAEKDDLIRVLPDTGHFTMSFDAVKDRLEPSLLSHFSADPQSDANDSKPEIKDNLEPIPISHRKKKKKRSSENSHKGVVFSSLFKAIMYIVLVFAVSLYAAYFLVKAANDIFAFEKGQREALITVTEGLTTEELADVLAENNIISYPTIFQLYIKYKVKIDNANYIPGDYTITANMNYDEIVTLLTVVPYVREEISVTVPEGYSTDQIIDLLVSKGIGTREGYIDVLNNYPFKHKFIEKLNELTLSEYRTYKLDGYLFPDTYLFYKDDKEVNVINKFLNNFENKFAEKYYVRCEKLNMTFDEVITLASMIQAEAKLAIDFEYISSVFHNRLESSSFPYLESDATVQYCLTERNEDLTQSDLDIDNPYNTYKYQGLPPGPICNPGIDAITSALFPDDPLDSRGNAFTAYYFVSNKYGKTYYAATNRSHESNKEQVKVDNAAYEAAQKPEEDEQ